MISENILSMANGIKNHDYKSFAKALSLIDNGSPEYKTLFNQLTINYKIPVIGITGPPGAGKSTLINCLLKDLTAQHKKICILAVDPSSPLHSGSLLGDRIRMKEYFNHPDVFIRSIASRGASGGVSSHISEMADLARAFGFDFVIIETVGTGQTEIEITRLADITLLVLVPGYGDDIQVIKSGIIEIADIIVVNKSDHHEADILYNQILQRFHTKQIVKTSAMKNEGIDILVDYIGQTLLKKNPNTKSNEGS